jgi:hypothetical protein
VYNSSTDSLCTAVDKKYSKLNINQRGGVMYLYYSLTEMFVMSREVTEAMKYFIDLFKKKGVARYTGENVLKISEELLGVASGLIPLLFSCLNMSTTFCLVCAFVPTHVFVILSSCLGKTPTLACCITPYALYLTTQPQWKRLRLCWSLQWTYMPNSPLPSFGSGPVRVVVALL